MDEISWADELDAWMVRYYELHHAWPVALELSAHLYNTPMGHELADWAREHHLRLVLRSVDRVGV